MIALLICVRILSFVIWAANIVRLFPAARRAFTAERRYLDPIWAVACAGSINRIWFVGRDIYYHPEPGPVEAGALVVGYMMACVIAGAIYKLRSSYGDE